MLPLTKIIHHPGAFKHTIEQPHLFYSVTKHRQSWSSSQKRTSVRDAKRGGTESLLRECQECQEIVSINNIKHFTSLQNAALTKKHLFWKPKYANFKLFWLEIHTLPHIWTPLCWRKVATKNFHMLNWCKTTVAALIDRYVNATTVKAQWHETFSFPNVTTKSTFPSLWKRHVCSDWVLGVRTQSFILSTLVASFHVTWQLVRVHGNAGRTAVRHWASTHTHTHTRGLPCLSWAHFPLSSKLSVASHTSIRNVVTKIATRHSAGSQNQCSSKCNACTSRVSILAIPPSGYRNKWSSSSQGHKWAGKASWRPLRQDRNNSGAIRGNHNYLPICSFPTMTK